MSKPSKVREVYTASSCSYTVEQALQDALREHNRIYPLQHILIVGQYDDGDLFIRSSKMPKMQANWLIDRAKHHTVKRQEWDDDEFHG